MWILAIVAILSTGWTSTDPAPKLARGRAVITRRAHEETNRMATRQHLTIADFCDEFAVARSTFYEWRAKGRAPRCIKLPNGEIRMRRSDVDRWLDTCEEAA